MPPRGWRQPIEERFWQRVEKTATCWLWTGGQHIAGYGLIREGGADGRMLRAHRVAYELLVGPIPDGLVIDHLCRVRNCVNPAHMEPVTRGENTLRGETITARQRAQTHCKRGHELAGRNLIPDKRGLRRCRECANARTRRLRRERQLAA